MAKETNFGFLAIFSGGRPFFSAVFPGLVSPDMFPGGRSCFSRMPVSPALHRAPLNELRPVHHEAIFGAPGLSRTREGGFRYRISPPYRRSLFFTPNASENASRTVGACFLHGAHIPYRRRPSPVPNSANARKEESIACTEYYKRQKGEGHCPEHGPECRREQENHSRHAPQTQKPSITSLSPQPSTTQHPHPATTTTHPTTSIHSTPGQHKHTHGHKKRSPD